MSDSGWLLLSHEPEFLTLHYRRGAGKPTWEKRGKSESFHKYGEYMGESRWWPSFLPGVQRSHKIALSPTFAHHGNGYMMGKSDKFFKTY
jgi:hypothetical protein